MQDCIFLYYFRERKKSAVVFWERRRERRSRLKKNERFRERHVSTNALSLGCGNYLNNYFQDSDYERENHFNKPNFLDEA